MPRKQFRFEYGWPCCSCYTELDLRYLAAKSKSLEFDRERFIYNSDWMGVDESFISKQKADKIEEMYFVETIQRYGQYVGTRLSDRNRRPFFFRWDDDRWGSQVVFTLRAIFAGRDQDKTRPSSLRESCKASCLVCGAIIEGENDEFNENRINHGVMLEFGHNEARHEIICEDCYLGWRGTRRVNYMRYNETRPVNEKELVGFIRFMMSKTIDNGERENKEINHDRRTNQV